SELRAQSARRRRPAGGAGVEAGDPRVGGGRGARVGGPAAHRGAVSEPALLPHRPGRQGADRPGGRGDREGPARRDPARSRIRRGRPVRPARHASDVPGGGRERARAVRCGAARGLAIPRRVAGVVAHRSRRAGAALPGRAACQDPRHLQASVPKGHGAFSRRARRSRVLAARRGAERGNRGAGRPAGTARVFRDGSLPHSHTEGGRAMNAMTARGLSLAAVVAVWTAISEMAKVNLSLWPVIVALGCSLAAGGGIPGLQRTVAATISGVVWALLANAVSRALGDRDVVQALVLGAAAFGMVLQAQVPVLSYTAGAVAGAGVAMGLRAVSIRGGIRVA